MKRQGEFWVALWIVLCAFAPYIVDALPQFDIEPAWWITVFLLTMASLYFYTARSKARTRGHI